MKNDTNEINNSSNGYENNPVLIAKLNMHWTNCIFSNVLAYMKTNQQHEYNKFPHKTQND